MIVWNTPSLPKLLETLLFMSLFWRHPKKILYLVKFSTQCFKKSQCPKLGGWFSNWPNKKFFWKSNCTDGKRHYQLAYIQNFNQFRHTVTKIIIHLDAKIWKLVMKTKLRPDQIIIFFYWQLFLGCKIAHWKVCSNLD
jgi:hypothetical protein